jgi:hypothetical protein
MEGAPQEAETSEGFEVVIEEVVGVPAVTAMLEI